MGTKHSILSKWLFKRISLKLNAEKFWLLKLHDHSPQSQFRHPSTNRILNRKIKKKIYKHLKTLLKRSIDFILKHRQFPNLKTFKNWREFARVHVRLTLKRLEQTGVVRPVDRLVLASVGFWVPFRSMVCSTLWCDGVL